MNKRWRKSGIRRLLLLFLSVVGRLLFIKMFAWSREPLCGSEETENEYWGQRLWHRYWNINWSLLSSIFLRPASTWRYPGSWWIELIFLVKAQPGRWAGWSRPAGGRTRWGRGGCWWRDSPETQREKSQWMYSLVPGLRIKYDFHHFTFIFNVTGTTLDFPEEA